MREDFYWLTWARVLKKHGLNGPAAVFLELLGPLNLILAQGFYFSQPFVKGILPEKQWMSMIDMLENQDQRQSFISYLKEETEWLNPD